MSKKPLILMTMQENGENGGPFVSHKRIMDSELQEKYDFQRLVVPRARYLINPIGMKKLVHEIQNHNPDIVQIAGLQLEGFLVTVACKLARVKTVLAVHGSLGEALSVKGLKRLVFLGLCLFVQQA